MFVGRTRYSFHDGTADEAQEDRNHWWGILYSVCKFLKFFVLIFFFRLHMHKSLTLFLLFSSDKLRKEINKVSRIKLVGTEDHCTYASFIFMSIWLVFLLLKDEFSDSSFQFFFTSQSADKNKNFSKVLRNVWRRVGGNLNYRKIMVVFDW